MGEQAPSSSRGAEGLHRGHLLVADEGGISALRAIGRSSHLPPSAAGSTLAFPRCLLSDVCFGVFPCRLGARRAGSWDTSSWWAAKAGGTVLPPRAVAPAPGTRHPSALLARPSPGDLLLLGEAR